MTAIQKRPYNSVMRKAKAKETRNRILDAAKRLFETDGFELVTINQIAKEAKVSAPTIYLIFQSKRGILRVIMDEALPPEQYSSLVEEHMKGETPQVRMKICAKLARELYDAERKEMNLVRGASLITPEFKELEQEREKRRYQRQEESVKALFDNKWLAPHLSLAEAKDIYWSFTGRDLYRLLVIERGWSSDAYEAWLSDLLIKALLK